MTRPVILAVLAISYTLSWAQSTRRVGAYQPSLKQPGCPMAVISDKGSALLLKNVSDKRIVGYVLACFAQRGKKYEPVLAFDAAQVSVEPGEFTFDGGFDATPLNQCRSQHWLMGVSEVAFSDGSSWKTHWLNKVAKHGKLSGVRRTGKIQTQKPVADLSMNQ